VSPEINDASHGWFGISPEGIGTVGMLLNVLVANVVSSRTPAPPLEIQERVEGIRIPRATSLPGE